jgi:hypothetical protein
MEITRENLFNMLCAFREVTNSQIQIFSVEWVKTIRLELFRSQIEHDNQIAKVEQNDNGEWVLTTIGETSIETILERQNIYQAILDL